MGSPLPRQASDIAKLRARLDAAQQKPVKLRVVACLLHHQLRGDSRSSMRGPQYLELLNHAAAELSRVAPVYRLDRGGVMTPIGQDDLAGAHFHDGGNILRTAGGAVHHPLAMRRAEAIEAISLLT